jgi:hypothetical protein
MAAGWLNHLQLMIVKGIGKTPTDNLSIENDPVNVNLLSGIISLSEWSPNIPAVKNGGVWSDSPINDGRQLQVAASGNVIEKMSINITSTGYNSVMGALSSLNQMALDCRDFWQSKSQIDPVYLMWYVSCGAGPQYALLYNIEIAPEYLDSPTPAIRASITLEREPFWRGIPPGANPKLWTFYVNKVQPNTTNVDFVSQTNDLVYNAAVPNRFEWDTAYANPTSKNYVDIPASLIPGDAPALMQLIVRNRLWNSNSMYNIYAARSTTPITKKDRTGATVLQTNTLNAGDAEAPANWTKTLDATCGCIGNGSAVNKYIGANAALATGTYVDFARWSRIGTVRIIDPNLLTGTFAVFLRCKQLNGATGDVQVRVSVLEFYSSFKGDYYNMPLRTGAIVDCDNRFDMLYLGTVTLPLAGDIGGGNDGRGLYTFTKTGGDGSFAIGFDLKQNNVAARSLQFLDMTFLPIGEALVQMQGGFGALNAFNVLDNTGYITHGENDPTARNWVQNATDLNLDCAIEARGPSLTLVPNVNNRLFFIQQRRDAATSETYSAPQTAGNNDMEVKIDIVPRWSGIRDS